LLLLLLTAVFFICIAAILLQPTYFIL